MLETQPDTLLLTKQLCNANPRLGIANILTRKNEPITPKSCSPVGGMSLYPTS